MAMRTKWKLHNAYFLKYMNFLNEFVSHSSWIYLYFCDQTEYKPNGIATSSANMGITVALRIAMFLGSTVACTK